MRRIPLGDGVIKFQWTAYAVLRLMYPNAAYSYYNYILDEEQALNECVDAQYKEMSKNRATLYIKRIIALYPNDYDYIIETKQKCRGGGRKRQCVEAASDVSTVAAVDVVSATTTTTAAAAAAATTTTAAAAADAEPTTNGHPEGQIKYGMQCRELFAACTSDDRAIVISFIEQRKIYNANFAHRDAATPHGEKFRVALKKMFEIFEHARELHHVVMSSIEGLDDPKLYIQKRNASSTEMVLRRLKTLRGKLRAEKNNGGENDTNADAGPSPMDDNSDSGEEEEDEALPPLVTTQASRKRSRYVPANERLYHITAESDDATLEAIALKRGPEVVETVDGTKKTRSPQNLAMLRHFLSYVENERQRATRVAATARAGQHVASKIFAASTKRREREQAAQAAQAVQAAQEAQAQADQAAAQEQAAQAAAQAQAVLDQAVMGHDVPEQAATDYGEAILLEQEIVDNLMRLAALDQRWRPEYTNAFRKALMTVARMGVVRPIDRKLVPRPDSECLLGKKKMLVPVRHEDCPGCSPVDFLHLFFNYAVYGKVAVCGCRRPLVLCKMIVALAHLRALHPDFVNF